MDRRTFLHSSLLLGGAALMPETTAFDLEAETTRAAALKAAHGRGVSGALEAMEVHAFKLRSAFTRSMNTKEAVQPGNLVADVGQHLAHVLYKNAGYAQGAWWADEAQHAARRIGNADLAIISGARKSIIRTATGNPVKGIEIAMQAKRQNGGAYARAFAEIQLAYAHAAMRSAAAQYHTLAALDRAETCIDAAVDMGDPMPIQTLDLTAGWLNYHRGALLVTSQPKEADGYLASILDGLPEGMKLSRAGIQIRQAMGMVTRGEYPEAVRLTKEGLLVAIPAGAMRDIWRAMRLRNRMGELKAPSRLVRELDDALEPMRDVLPTMLLRHGRPR
jgi:hypothetical protein